MHAAATCVDDFKKAMNTLAYHGQREVGAKTVDSCQSRCLADSDCVGFDFDDKYECFTQTNITLFRDVFPGPGVAHYTREKCTPPGKYVARTLFNNSGRDSDFPIGIELRLLLLLIFIRTRSGCNMFHVIMSEQRNNQKKHYKK